MNPLLGVIAAWLYDAAGDRDSVRRLTMLYAEHRQPVPFDIALLAGVPGRRGRDGLIRIDLQPGEVAISCRTVWYAATKSFSVPGFTSNLAISVTAEPASRTPPTDAPDVLIPQVWHSTRLFVPCNSTSLSAMA